MRMERAKERKEDREKIISKSELMGKPKKGGAASYEADEGDSSFLNEAHEGDAFNPSSPQEKATLCKSTRTPSGDSLRTNPSGDSDSSSRASKEAASTANTTTTCKRAGHVKSSSPKNGSSSSESARCRSLGSALHKPWFFTICSVSVLSLMAMALAWTYVSYSSALSSMEDRLLRLEIAHLDYSRRIEAMVSKTVDARLKEVLDQVSSERCKLSNLLDIMLNGTP